MHLTALERFILGDPLPTEDIPDDLPHVKNDVGKSNERWIESRRAWTGADALAEFRAATARAHRAAPERSTTPGSRPTPGRRWARAPSPTCCGSASSTRGCTSRTCGAAVDRPGDLDSAGRRAGARHDGRGAAVHRREEGGGSRRFHRRARAHRTAAPHRRRRGGRRSGPPARRRCPPTPTVTLTLASDVFARLACGRSDPAEAAGARRRRDRRRRRARRRDRAPAQLHVLNARMPTPRTEESRWIWSPTSCAGASPTGSCCSLHGYGADERDLGGLLALPRPRGPLRRRCCPGARMRAPAARLLLVRHEPRRPERDRDASPRRSPPLDDLLDAACAEHGLPRSEAIVGGFSQGAGLALALGAAAERPAAPRRRARDEPVRCPGLDGLDLDDAAAGRSRCSSQHGTDDPMIPVQQSRDARRARSRERGRAGRVPRVPDGAPGRAREPAATRTRGSTRSSRASAPTSRCPTTRSRLVPSVTTAELPARGARVRACR